MGKLGRKSEGTTGATSTGTAAVGTRTTGKAWFRCSSPDGSRIKDKGTPEEEIAAAYGRWKEAREAARKAAAQKPKSGKVTVEDVCRVYLAEASENGARETFLGRADTLFDLCYGLPARFRAKDGTPKPMTEERKKEAKTARIHPGYGRMEATDFIPLHIDEWLRAHKSWKGSRRSRIQAVKRAFSYAKKSGLIAENRISKYSVPRARSRATYITPEQEAILVEAANEADVDGHQGLHSYRGEVLLGIRSPHQEAHQGSRGANGMGLPAP